MTNNNFQFNSNIISHFITIIINKFLNINSAIRKLKSPIWRCSLGLWLHMVSAYQLSLWLSMQTQDSSLNLQLLQLEIWNLFPWERQLNKKESWSSSPDYHVFHYMIITMDKRGWETGGVFLEQCLRQRERPPPVGMAVRASMGAKNSRCELKID